MNRTGREYQFRLIALAAIAVLTTCLLLVGGAFRLQSTKLQQQSNELNQVREELAQERHTIFTRDFFMKHNEKLSQDLDLNEKTIRDLEARLKAYEAANTLELVCDSVTGAEIIIPSASYGTLKEALNKEEERIQKRLRNREPQQP